MAGHSSATINPYNERPMKKFIVKINAYDHYAKFDILAQDDAPSIEQAIIDKLGENVIKWEHVGRNVFSSDRYRITYEEVINANAKTTGQPLQQKEGSGLRMGAGAS